MIKKYSIVSGSLQSGMDKAIRELAKTHHGELHISGGSLLHIQVRLPAENTQKFINDVNSAACGQIKWSVV